MATITLIFCDERGRPILRSLPSLCHAQNAVPPDSLYALARFLDDKGFGASANSETKAFQL